MTYMPGFKVVLTNPEVEFNDVVDFTLITSEFTIGQDLFTSVHRLLNQTQTKAIEERLNELLDVLYHDISLVLGLNVSKDKIRTTVLNKPENMELLTNLYTGYLDKLTLSGSVPYEGLLSSIAHHRYVNEKTVPYDGFITRLYNIVNSGLLINLVNYIDAWESDKSTDGIDIPEVFKLSLEKHGTAETVTAIMNSFTNLFCSTQATPELLAGVNVIDRYLINLVLHVEI